MQYKVISADTHIIEPPHLWQKWLAPEFRKYAPRMVKDQEGGDAWQYTEGTPPAPIGLVAVKRGRKYEDADYKWTGHRMEDMNQGAFFGEPRLLEQNEDGVDAEVIYAPNRAAAHFMGVGIPEVSVAGVRAYNDWLAKEFCAVDPRRLIGLALIPYVGIDAAIAELERAHQMGMKGCHIMAWPSGGTNISPADDPFWAAAERLGMSVNIHVRLSAKDAQKPMTAPSQYAQKSLGKPSPTIGALVVQSVGALAHAPELVAELVFSGTFDRFPRLQIVFGETGVAWVPFLLEAMDDHYERDRRWCHTELARTPGTYWKTNFAATFIIDRYGMRNRDLIGAESILWSTDYPHHRCDWLESQRIIEEHMQGVRDSEKAAMLAGNAVRIYGLES